MGELLVFVYVQTHKNGFHIFVLRAHALGSPHFGQKHKNGSCFVVRAKHINIIYKYNFLMLTH